jgi:hypothetical protein
MKKSATTPVFRLTPELRVMRLVGAVVLPVWLAIMLVFFISGASKGEFLAATVFFAGLIGCWGYTAYVLKKKGDAEVESLMSDHDVD